MLLWAAKMWVSVFNIKLYITFPTIVPVALIVLVDVKLCSEYSKYKFSFLETLLKFIYEFRLIHYTCRLLFNGRVKFCENENWIHIVNLELNEFSAGFRADIYNLTL